ncbi:DNA primase, partial [Klebsiella pneumoniae]
PVQPVLFNGRSSDASGYTTSGTELSLRDSVGGLVCGYDSKMTGGDAALTAPLIGHTGSDDCGIPPYEKVRARMTTPAIVAASLSGNPEVLRRTWYGSALGLANEPAAHNDTLLPLDEIGQGADQGGAHKSASALFNGTRKPQGAKEGGNREL